MPLPIRALPMGFKQRQIGMYADGSQIPGDSMEGQRDYGTGGIGVGMDNNFRRSYLIGGIEPNGSGMQRFNVSARAITDMFARHGWGVQRVNTDSDGDGWLTNSELLRSFVPIKTGSTTTTNTGSTTSGGDTKGWGGTTPTSSTGAGYSLPAWMKSFGIWAVIAIAVLLFTAPKRRRRK